ncbi:hypothetical protein EDB92DRAFT_1895021 [Lactarius akahatsu]|uniref:Uncharacterized protein n=1 Tax=Lactarius akahatsu TaxID=416441 RepID=A0AAD4L861_9AGAM|nr:hypothetical protein EDB92DRAFT_1895021 [Lactarius akahatsu]
MSFVVRVDAVASEDGQLSEAEFVAQDAATPVFYYHFFSSQTQYRNSLHCAYRIFTEEGLRRFWTGTTPRLARLVMNGGIVFTIYEKVIVLIGGRGS